ncbi:unnamed protein product, partial [Hapterophycus canaliculatus]
GNCPPGHGTLLWRGGSDIRSAARGDGEGRWPATTFITGSTHFQACHGSDGNNSQAEHEGIQKNRGKQHLKVFNIGSQNLPIVNVWHLWKCGYPESLKIFVSSRLTHLAVLHERGDATENRHDR